jgi:hypothetical protein
MGYFLHRNGQSVPFKIADLREMAQKGELAQDEYIYVEEKGEWVGAGQVPEMNGAWNIGENEATVAMELPADFYANFDAQHAASAPAPAPAPVAAPAPKIPAAPSSPAPVAAAPPRTPAPAPEPMRAPEPMKLVGGGGGGAGRAGGGGGGGRKEPLNPGPILNPVTVTILAMVTCGIYPLIWLFKRSAEINAFLGREEIKTTHLIIGLFCFPFILLGLWKMIKALPEMGQKAGLRVEDRSTLMLVCALCVAPAFYFLYQTDLNAIWEAAGAKPAA